MSRTRQPLHARNAVLYLRLSQDRTVEGEVAAGIERQREDCLAKAAEEKLTVIGEYVDNGKSAYSGRPRPEFEQMLADARAGAFGVVVAWSTDRLYRQVRDLTRITSELAPFARIVTCKGGDVDLSSAEGILRAQMLGSVAEFESRRKGERVKRAALQRAEAGRWSGGMRPYGYEADGVTVRETEADVLRDVYADIVAGVSLREVTRRLNDAGHTTSGGGQWVAQHLRTLLLSPRFMGISSYHGVEKGPAEWPGIVSEEIHRTASRILRDPARRTTPGPAPKHMLSGVVHCGRCGAPCRVSATGGKDRVRRYVYRCGKGHVLRSREALEQYVEDATLALLEREQVRPIRPSRAKGGVTAEADKLRARLDDLAEAFAAGELTREQTATATRSLTARLEAVEARLEHRAKVSVIAPLAGQNAREAWAYLSVERRRAVLRALWGTIVLNPMPTGVSGVNPEGVRMVAVWDSAAKGDPSRVAEGA